MAINGTWVGSSAKSETGKEWMSQAGSEVKVGTPFWMSSLIGKSKSSIQAYITSSDHNYNADKLLNVVRSVLPQNQWSGSELTLYVNGGVQLVSSSTGAACIDLSYLSAFKKITLINSGTILGRGGRGKGGANAVDDGGSNGGPAINIGSANNWKVWIDNRGVIGGGGGGGGAAMATNGGGGAPFGLKGYTKSTTGTPATDASYGSAGVGGKAGDNRGGNGGWYGAAGAAGTGYVTTGGTSAGAAIAYNGGNVTYINAGTMYGSR